MSAILTCIVAPSSSIGIRETLRDWQAGGLVSDFLWLSAEAMEMGQATGHQVTDGSLIAVDLRRLAGQTAYAQIRLAELCESDLLNVGEGSSQAEDVFSSGSAGAQIRRIIEGSFGNSNVSPLRILLTGTKGPALVKAPQSVGWHYLVVSPEDTSAPGVGAAPLDANVPADADIQRASQLAGILGLWSGIDEAPLDTEETASYVRFRLYRSFFRRLSGDAVELDVRNRLLDVDTGYPRPTHESGRCTYVENPTGAARQAVSQLWTANAHILRSPRDVLKESQSKEISMGEALRMLFSFLWASLIGAPAAWASRAVRGVQAAVASSVQEFVFGADHAAYQVVVSGQRSDGKPAGWQDLQTAARELERGLPDHEQTAHEELSGLWREYTNGAFTLADGGVHGAIVRPILVNSDRAVMRNPRDIVPNPSDSFPALKGALGATLGSKDLEATDIVAIDDQGRQLQAESTRGSELSREAASALHMMAQWREGNSQTYSSLFGAELSKAIHSHRNELAELLRRMRDAAGGGSAESARLQKKQKRLGTIMRVIAVVAVLLIGTLALLGGVSVLSWGWAGGLMAAVALGWLITSFIVFMRGQRELFRLINRRRSLESQAEVDSRNITAALRDLTRVTDAYSQYLNFTRALSHFIHQPFGRPRTATEQETESFSDLPRSTAQGRITTDEAVVQETALELRHGQFQAGWMDSLWSKYLNQAAPLIGPRGMELRDDSDLLFRVRGSGDDSLLHLWADALDERPVSSRFGDPTWESARQRLDREPSLNSVRTRLTERVASMNGAVALERFVGEVGTPTSDPIGQSLLDATAIAADAARTQKEFIRTAELGLGRAVVHVQMTGPVEPLSLGFSRDRVGSDQAVEDDDNSDFSKPFGDAAF